MHDRSSTRSSVALFMSLVLVTLVACGRTTEQTGTLRAEAVEIIDEKGTTKMNVADRIRALEERVQKLEAALEKRAADDKAAEEKRALEEKRAADAATPVPSAAPSSSVKPASTSPWHLAQPKPASPGPAPSGRAPDVF